MIDKNYKRFNRATITDGKLIDRFILQPYKTTDDELLAELSNVGGDVIRVYDIVSENSATKWDNDLVSGFSAVSFDDTMTALGSGYCSATFGFVNSPTVEVSKSENNTFVFNTTNLASLTHSYYSRALLNGGYIDTKDSVALGNASAYRHSVAKGNGTVASDYGFAIATSPINSTAVSTSVLFTTRESNFGKANFVENHSFGMQGVDLHGSYLFGAYDASAKDSSECVILYNSSAVQAASSIAIFDSYVTGSPAYALWHSSATLNGVALYDSTASDLSLALYNSTAVCSSIATYNSTAAQSAIARYNSTAANQGHAYYDSWSTDQSIAWHNSESHVSGIAFNYAYAVTDSFAMHHSSAASHSLAMDYSVAESCSLAANTAAATGNSIAMNCGRAENNSISLGYKSSAYNNSVCYGTYSTASDYSMIFAGSGDGTTIASNHSICNFRGSSTVSSIASFNSTANDHSISMFTSTADNHSIALHGSTATISSVALFNSNAKNKSIAIYNSTADNETLAILSNKIEINSKGQYNGVKFSYANSTLSVD